jgi:hypothetical protein
LLTADALFAVCDFCRDLSEAMTKLPTLFPDVVLIDATLRDGPACVPRIQIAIPGIKVVSVGLPRPHKAS